MTPTSIVIIALAIVAVVIIILGIAYLTGCDIYLRHKSSLGETTFGFDANKDGKISSVVDA